MEAEFQRLLPAPEDEAFVRYRNLVRYLAQFEGELNYFSYPPTLSLIGLSQYSQELHMAPAQVNFWDDKQFDYLREFVRKHSLTESVELLVNAERSRIIYYDPQNGRTAATEVKSGSVFEVSSELLTVWNQKKVPLIEVHTHPIESLPSIQDYLPVLVDPLGIGEDRLIRAVEVLTPNHQILALASAQTPRYPPDKALEIVNSAAKGISDAEMLVSINNQIGELYSRIGSFGVSNIDRASFLYEHFGRIPGANYLITRLLHGYATLRLGQLANEQRRLSKQSADIEQHLINQEEINFVRQNWIKLYLSSDFENFYEFSA